MSKKKAKSSLTDMSIEDLTQELEGIDAARIQALKEHRNKGRQIKAEIERRNTEETLISKIARQLPLTEQQTAKYRAMSQSDRKRIAGAAVKKMQDLMDKIKSSVEEHN